MDCCEYLMGVCVTVRVEDLLSRVIYGFGKYVMCICISCDHTI